MDITKAYSTNMVPTPHPIGVNTNPQSFAPLHILIADPMGRRL